MRNEGLWEAKPHTLAKIKILEQYLDAWFAIVGRTYTGSIIYVDGFAGPGAYKNARDGSPIIALQAGIRAASTAGSKWRAKNIHYFFLEKERSHFNALKNKVISFSSDTIRIHPINTTFEEGLRNVYELCPESGAADTPLFVFVDPFGATGAPFSLIRKILSSPCSEVLVNLDADGIGRIFKAQENASHEKLLTEIYGDDSWYSRFKQANSFDRLSREALRLYRDKLQTIPRLRYTFPFEMRSNRNTLEYFLVFASQHRLGLEKMKEAMIAIDKTGQFQFSDAYSNQVALFTYNQPAKWADEMSRHFSGSAVKWYDVFDYALTNTPFSNPKSMLKYLEDSGKIEVRTSQTNRRRGTFGKPELIQSIDFSDRE